LPRNRKTRPERTADQVEGLDSERSVTVLSPKSRLNSAGLGPTLRLTAWHFIFTYFSPTETIFGVEAVPLSVWKWLLLGGVIFFLIVELEKFIIRKMLAQSEEPAAA
jgi:hypothetical protein